MNSWLGSVGVRKLPIQPIATVASDPDFEQECVGLLTGFLHALGLPNSVGAIYGLLFASIEPLCLAQIVEKLGASKGSVSQGLSFLRQAGAVKVIEIPGDRREYFEPELGLRRLASGLISDRIRPLAQETRLVVARLSQCSASSKAELQKFHLSRIKQLDTWHRQLGRVLPLVQVILRSPRQ